MALATAVATITSTDITQKNIEVYGTIAIGASPLTYATGGAILDFSGVPNTNSVPVAVTVVSSPAAGTSPSGFIYQYCPGATIALGTLAIFTGAAAQSALTELTAGATPAAVSGDTIRFKATFPRI